MKSYMAKPNEIERKWYIIDAEDKVLGRLATEVDTILRGKRSEESREWKECRTHCVDLDGRRINKNR